MHLRGHDMTYVAKYPDGREEILLSVPKYDFNWQITYELAAPKLLPKGTKLECIAHFDNSSFNPYNPDPDRNQISDRDPHRIADRDRLFNAQAADRPKFAEYQTKTTRVMRSHHK